MASKDIIALSKTGYAGLLPNGQVVDRRCIKGAMPIPANEQFDVPNPLPVAGDIFLIP